jgi:hypothetical protein
MTVIGDLIRTAAPSLNPAQRRRRYARGLILWGILLKLLGPREGEDLEHPSMHWPSAIRRRLESAVLRRRRRRWPYAPFAASEISLRFKCQTLSAVYGLAARKPTSRPLSRV